MLYAGYASEGYLDDKFWPDYYTDDYDEESTTVVLQNVPSDIAEKLVAQGTGEQWFSDGYEAAQYAAPYLP